MPEKLITYTQKFTVYRTDGDHLGHVKLGALLRYAQQVATAHAEAVGLDDALYRKTHTAYVLAKLALHIEHLPRVDEELTLLTQPENCKRAVNKRITHFYDASGAEAAVCANSTPQSRSAAPGSSARSAAGPINSAPAAARQSICCALSARSAIILC